ncbi:hypothetical protein UFOVP1246_8 [uncultured Caudovirales phage]|uniref:Uncharacterized protein n=1 Tax=uncultured Caudovirales phage TaxID=2100421 RepID=A0A6J5RER5_9CAUD|nr:hypothetical protein UFOVP1246_8 [uncultured Caudovirales phage]
MNTRYIRLLLCLVAIGEVATGIEASTFPETDWPRSIYDIHIGGLDNFIAAALVLCFVVTMSTRCRLIATAALVSGCITELIAAALSSLKWQSRVGHIGQALVCLGLVLLLNKQFSKVAANGH